MEIKTKIKYWNWIIILFGLIPFGFIISILSFYFHAGHILGRFPSYCQPDPTDLTIYATYSPFIDITGGIWVVSLLAWPIVIIAYLFINRKNISWRLIISSVVGQIIAILLFSSKISEWYFD